MIIASYCYSYSQTFILLFFIIGAICSKFGVAKADEENRDGQTATTTEEILLQNVKKRIGGLEDELKKTREVFEEFVKEFRKASAEQCVDPTNGAAKENAVVSNKLVEDNIEKLYDKMAVVENMTNYINHTLWKELSNCGKWKEKSSTNTTKSEKKDFRVVCYFPSYTYYREYDDRFYPEKIDPSLCTHIIYAFLSLNPNTSLVYSNNENLDFSQRFYERVTSLKAKKPSLKVMIALGGWTDSKGDKYSRLINDTTRRFEFVKHVTKYLKDNEFDGLDLDWEFPVCWRANCSKGPVSDMDNFALLVEELRAEFDKQEPSLLLTAAVSAYAPIIDKAYDVPRLSKSLDFFNVMTYDLAGPWNKQTGHHSAMFYEGDINLIKTVDYAMRHWIRKGAPKKKLIMGVPAYGRNFTLVSAEENGINAPTTNVTHPSGIPYYEVCRRVKHMNWTKENVKHVGPYAYKDTQWVSYDDPQSIIAKARYVRKNEFGGMMMWNIAQDDFNALCCVEKYPLLKAINMGLFENKDFSVQVQTFDCE